MANSILGFIARRLLLAVPVFVGVTLVTFVLMQIVPGDPVALLMEEKVASVDPDAASIICATIGVSIPNFWLGLLLIYLLAVHWRWLPPSGYGPAYPYLIMPAITLGTALSAVIARLSRSSMLDVIRADYIRTARAKG